MRDRIQQFNPGQLVSLSAQSQQNRYMYLAFGHLKVFDINKTIRGQCHKCKLLKK